MKVVKRPFLKFFCIVLAAGHLACSTNNSPSNPNTPTPPTVTYSYLGQWGDTGSGNGQFNLVEGIAIDALGNVYVVDHSNHRVEKFTTGGLFGTKWGALGTANGQFTDPNQAAVDSSGNVFVADTDNNRIQKFDSNGNYLLQWGSSAPATGGGNGQFQFPYGAAVDSSGNVYVADAGNNRIQKFDSNGNYLLKWGSSAPATGSANGQFNHPVGVAVDPSGNIFVSDENNQRVQKFDPVGTYLTQFGSASGNGQLSIPACVATDSIGNVFVVDQGGRNVVKFDSNGNYLTQFGSIGSGNGQFNSPYGVAVDSTGKVYVSDYSRNSVQVFAPH